MKKTEESQRGSRREFLFVIGGAALSLPLLGCAPEEAEPPPTSDDDPSDQGTDDPVPPDQAASELGQRPEQVGGQAPEQPGGEQPAAGQASGQESAPPASVDLPKIEESDAMAQALGYKHDAGDVDLEQFPSRGDAGSANEFCHNCVHFQVPAGGDPRWAPCTIFPGKLVNADGWCSAWAAKA